MAPYHAPNWQPLSALPTLASLIESMVESAEQVSHYLHHVHLHAPHGRDDATVERLAVALSRATKKTIEVRVVVDPELMGGIVATIGDTVIDGTVRHRLDQLKETL